VRLWTAGLRQSALNAGGYLFVMEMPEKWRGELDRVGYLPDTYDLMKALKARWDPAEILTNPYF
jgi:hypothetical protein